MEDVKTRLLEADRLIGEFLADVAAVGRYTSHEKFDFDQESTFLTKHDTGERERIGDSPYKMIGEGRVKLLGFQFREIADAMAAVMSQPPVDWFQTEVIDRVNTLSAIVFGDDSPAKQAAIVGLHTAKSRIISAFAQWSEAPVEKPGRIPDATNENQEPPTSSEADESKRTRERETTVDLAALLLNGFDANDSTTRCMPYRKLRERVLAENPGKTCSVNTIKNAFRVLNWPLHRKKPASKTKRIRNVGGNRLHDVATTGDLAIGDEISKQQAEKYVCESGVTEAERDALLEQLRTEASTPQQIVSVVDLACAQPNIVRTRKPLKSK